VMCGNSWTELCANNCIGLAFRLDNNIVIQKTEAEVKGDFRTKISTIIYILTYVLVVLLYTVVRLHKYI
jgi:hypothetical protein